MRSCSALVEWRVIARTGSSTSNPAGWPAQNGQGASARCWTAGPDSCHRPHEDGDSPPVEVTFPDGDVVRTDDGGAELTGA